MDNKLYSMIFKRKSFHTFKFTGKESITLLELEEIRNKLQDFTALDNDIKVDMQILPAENTSCKRGQEYTILLYSEKKDNYLQNIGYIGEQLDLYLALMNIGALWFGIGKVNDVKYNGLDFVIMIAIKKVSSDKFRKDMFKSKRKLVDEIWNGELIGNIPNIVRFAPSACNSQPWFIENDDQCISVFRYKKEGKCGIMPMNKISYYNRIDIGIFLLFLELSFEHEEICFDRELFYDNGNDDEKTLIAKYYI